MAGIRNYHVSCFGPRARELVGAADRADHGIAALHDDPGQPPDLPDPGDQIAVAGEQVTAEEMSFDSRETESEAVIAKGRHRLRVGQQCRAGPLIDAPGACRGHVDPWIRI